MFKPKTFVRCACTLGRDNLAGELHIHTGMFRKYRIKEVIYILNGNYYKVDYPNTYKKVLAAKTDLEILALVDGR